MGKKSCLQPPTSPRSPPSSLFQSPPPSSHQLTSRSGETRRRFQLDRGCLLLGRLGEDGGRGDAWADDVVRDEEDLVVGVRRSLELAARS
eukprot:768267-Hanusia_phi.AAC.2